MQNLDLRKKVRNQKKWPPTLKSRIPIDRWISRQYVISYSYSSFCFSILVPSNVLNIIISLSNFITISRQSQLSTDNKTETEHSKKNYDAFEGTSISKQIQFYQLIKHNLIFITADEAMNLINATTIKTGMVWSSDKFLCKLWQIIM